MRPALHLLLILLVAATSLSLGHARGQARIAGEVVLCAGERVVTVTVDENGTPVRHVTLCPDMALSLLAGLDLPPVALPMPAADARAAVVVAATKEAGLPPVAAQARGPPVGGLPT